MALLCFSRAALVYYLREALGTERKEMTVPQGLTHPVPSTVPYSRGWRLNFVTKSGTASEWPSQQELLMEQKLVMAENSGGLEDRS